ncbi:MAG: Rrf2 family transcriptional regulator [Treponema sp.]|jgi:Rrf2 family protein|nr:Rrf2 family transcriptional regulator [Treponema sp.]
MFITKESDYAVRILRELKDGEKRTVPDICDQESIPYQYAYKIIKKLEKAGLVKSYRGAGGGYRLSKNTARITLFDVINAVSEEALLFECLRHGHRCPMNEGGRKCRVHAEFNRVQNIILSTLKEKSLAEIL